MMELSLRSRFLMIPITLSWVACSAQLSFAATDQVAIFDLVVNLAKKSEIPIRIRASEVLVRVTDLQQAGLTQVSGTREILEGDTYVALSSLAPTLRYELDADKTTLHLTVEPSLLKATVLDLAAKNRPANLLYSQDTSLFLNYAVNAQDLKQYSLFSEIGLSFGNNLLYSNLNRNQAGKLVRGLTNLTLDHPTNMTRWVLGDQFANTDELGGAAFIAGVSYSRNFSLDPYFLRSPTLGISGAALTPSTLDVYVNDSLVKREQLPPGPFQIKDLPVVSGSGLARLVIRDALGQEQQINYPYYYSAGLLAPGLSEFSYSLGLRRNHLSTESFDYESTPVLLARHRLGLTDSLTAGLRLEASDQLLSGGATLSARLPFGDAGLAIAASHADGLSGTAATVSYSYSSKGFGLGLAARAMSDHYAHTSLKPTEDRATLDLSAFTSLQLSQNISLFGRYAQTHWRDQGTTTGMTLGSNIRLNSRANLTLSVNRSQRPYGDPTTELSLGLNYALGNGLNANLSHQRQENHATTTAQLQKSLPSNSGFGYRIQNRISDQQNSLSAMLQYQGPFGRYELNHDRFSRTDSDNPASSTQHSTTFSASGGVVAIGGQVLATQPVKESFALVEIPQVPGVQALLNNQVVGKTNSRGSVLIPNLLPYYGNRLGISAEQVPTNYSIGSTEQTVAPPYRGGAVVRFAVQKHQSIVGNLVVDGQNRSQSPRIPSYGQISLMVEGKPLVSPIGQQGEFYLENLPSGKHEAKIEDDRGICLFDLQVPPSSESVIKLGTLHCVVPSQEAKLP